MQILLGILVLVHGLITAAVGAGSISDPKGIAVPGTAWYPVALGQSWMLRGGAAKVGAGLWVMAGSKRDAHREIRGSGRGGR